MSSIQVHPETHSGTIGDGLSCLSVLERMNNIETVSSQWSFKGKLYLFPITCLWINRHAYD